MIQRQDRTLFQATFNADLIGIEPITYRTSNDLLYAGGAFNPSQLFKLDWRGSTPVAINLSAPVAFNHFQFGPDGNLYSNDSVNNQIVKIAIDDVANTGTVTPVVTGIPYAVSCKVDSQGNLYYLSRTLGNVYQYNVSTNKQTILAAGLPPPLDDICLSLDEKQVYVTNNNNGIFQVTIATKQVTTLFQSPISQPWDLAYDSETDSVYVADTVGIKQFKASNGSLIRQLVFDSTQDNGLLVGSGNANGITVESGPNAKIVITDGTVGDIIVVNKSDLSFYDLLPFTAAQPFSTVRVTGGNPSEYYLITDTTNGNILKVYRVSPTEIMEEVYFSGLTGPVKLRINNGYLYVVEGGDLINFSTNTGRISRIPLIDNPTPADQEILVTGLNSPQGLDIYQNNMYIVEGGTKRVLQASANQPSVPSVVYDGLDLGNFIVISQFNPYPVYPFAGLAVDNKGKTVWVNQTNPVNILSIKL